MRRELSHSLAERFQISAGYGGELRVVSAGEVRIDDVYGGQHILILLDIAASHVQMSDDAPSEQEFSSVRASGEELRGVLFGVRATAPESVRLG